MNSSWSKDGRATSYQTSSTHPHQAKRQKIFSIRDQLGKTEGQFLKAESSIGVQEKAGG